MKTLDHRQQRPNDIQVIVGDRTPVVYLYHLHRKGLSIRGIPDEQKLARYRGIGFRYLISELPLQEIEALERTPHDVIRKIGDFTIVQLK